MKKWNDGCKTSCGERSARASPTAPLLTRSQGRPRRRREDPGGPTVLYNGMIAPIIPYASKE